MPRAVRFDHYGDVDVLEVVEVPRPVPAAGQLLVAVKAAGINPGEAKIRDGSMHERFPATFPSGEGSDLAGVVEEVGNSVTEFAPGDEVIGYTDERASHADFVLVQATNATPRPPGVPWEVAGALKVAGTTARAAVDAVAPKSGETVVVTGAAGGVGSLAVQLAALAGAKVIGVASQRHHDWLRSHGVTPVAYGDGIAERIRAAGDGGIDAVIDTSGSGYVRLALDLGVAPERIETIIDFAAAAQYGTKAVGGAEATSAETLRELAQLVADGKLEVPIAAVYPLDQVREAFSELEHGHVRGKIVLTP